MSMAKFESHSQMVATSATGGYRKMIARAEDITFDIVKTQSTSDDLLTPDYNTEKDPTPEIDEKSDIPITKALRIRFNLKPSSYATMFLREDTRTSSAFNVQHKLSLANN